MYQAKVGIKCPTQGHNTVRPLRFKSGIPQLQIGVLQLKIRLCKSTCELTGTRIQRIGYVAWQNRSQTLQIHRINIPRRRKCVNHNT